MTVEVGRGPRAEQVPIWRGILPAGWRVLPLKRIVALRSGVTITADEINEDGTYPVFGGNGFRGRTTSYTHDGTYALIGRQGALCGNVNVASGKFWASEHAIVPTPSKPISVVWLAALLEWMDLGQYSMSAAQPGIASDVIGRIPIPVPPFKIQEAIASFLCTESRQIESLILKQERLIELLAEKRQAVITHAVTKGLDSTVPTKPSGISWQGRVPAHWSIQPLKNLMRMQTGVTLGKDFTDVETTSYAYLRVANVQIGYVDLSDVKEIHLPRSIAESSLLRPGDVLMTEGGDRDKLARGCVWDGAIDPCVHQNHIFAVRTNAQLLNVFLVLALDADPARTYFYTTGKQSTNLASTNSTTVKNFRFGVPPVDEQGRIVEHLKLKLQQIDDLINKANKVNMMLRERRSALISAVVIGKLKI